MPDNTSRSFLLQWLASLGIHIKRIEDIGTGVALCKCLKLLDSTFPKFRETPKNEWEYLDNLKLIQEYFVARNVKVRLPIGRMSKLKLQDNLEVLQWFYKYCKKRLEETTLSTTSPNDGLKDMQDKTKASPPFISIMHIEAEQQEAPSPPRRVREEVAEAQAIREDQILDSVPLCEYEVKGGNHQKESQSQAQKLERCIRIIENERDFYFAKLALVEQLVLESKSLGDSDRDEILKILYDQSGTGELWKTDKQS